MRYYPNGNKGGWNHLDSEAIKQRITKKAGNWKILYPDINDIDKINIRVEVQCLDCGRLKTVGLKGWTCAARIDRGCPYCERDKHEKLS